MTSFTITYADGNTEHCQNYRAALEAILSQYPEAEIGHDGDIPDGGDRTLCWEDEAASLDDDGAHAIANIRMHDSGEVAR